MSVFEEERLLKAYRQGNNSPVNEPVTGRNTSSSELQIRRDKALGWIPNPRTPMNHFYNQVYESFFVENVSFLAVSKKKVFKRVPQGGETPVHGTPRSVEGEEENTAVGEHRKPLHSWLPTEGEPHIKAP